MRFRLFGLLIWPFLLPAAQRPPADPAPLTASAFAGLIQKISEEGGYFWNDNFVSNEASYQHPLGRLKELGIGGGVYLGVGPNQNLTYIAKLKPRYAFILDIRRQNLLEHLLFKAIFHYARNPREYLSILLSRAAGSGRSRNETGHIAELVAHFLKVDPDEALYRRNRARIRSYLQQACRLSLSEEDFAAIDKIHRAFLLRGLSIKYDYIPVPTYGELLLERDLEGNQQEFLNSLADFQQLKRMQEENRIIPLVGDFAGPHALRSLGGYLAERGEKVVVFYTSNVEQYLMRSRTWDRFVENVHSLPLDERALFIRTYWSTRIPHPEGIEGYTFTQVLQSIRLFLQNYSEGNYRSYWDLVTLDTIKLR